jgi:hypothetical protein
MFESFLTEAIKSGHLFQQDYFLYSFKIFASHNCKIHP